MRAGAIADGWVGQDDFSVVTEGFGFVRVDVFVKRRHDSKCAHLASIPFDFKEPNAPQDGVGVRHVSGTADEIEVVVESWGVCPTWLDEHVCDTYPMHGCR